MNLSLRLILVLAFATIVRADSLQVVIPFESASSGWSAQPVYPGPVLGVSMPLCFGETTSGPQTCMHDPDWTMPAHRDFTPDSPGFSDISALLTNGREDALYFWEPWAHWEVGSSVMVASGAWESAVLPNHRDLAGYTITGISRDITSLNWSYENNRFEFASAGKWTIYAASDTPPVPTPEPSVIAELATILMAAGLMTTTKTTRRMMLALRSARA